MSDTFHNIRPNGLATVADTASRLAFLPPNDGYTVVELDTHAIWIWNATTQTWVADGGGVPTYANLAAFPASAPDGTLGIALDTHILYEYETGTGWVPIAGPGTILGVGTFDSGTPSAKGAHIDTNQLIMQSASGSNPGLVNTGTQTFLGQKTFTTGLTGTLTGAASLNVLTSALGNLTSTPTTNLVVTGGNNAIVGSGVVLTLTGASIVEATSSVLTITGATNAVLGTGVSIAVKQSSTSQNGYLSSTDWNTFNNKQSTVTIGSLDAQSPNANGLALVSNVLSEQSADVTHPGLVNNTTQTFGGKKTFNAGLDANSNQITSVADPTTAQMAATKNYVDTQLAALNPADAVYAASTANIAGTYLNGVAGVGAIFTTTATTNFAIDGTTPAVGARILIKDQSSGFQNGIYTFTTQAVSSVSGAILTRSLDYNTASEMNSAGLIPVINGTVNALSSWQQVATITTVGTDSLVFTEFTANPSLYLLKANNLNDVASSSTSFNNISGLTTLGDTIYGGASGTRSKLSGNTTVAKQYLSQTGNGSVSAAPAWANIAEADVTNLVTDLANRVVVVIGDIVPTTWAGITNNTAGQTVTGLTFATTVSSFTCLMDVQIAATTPTFTTITIEGTRRASSDWSVASIQADFVGDAITGLAFDISSAGQVTISIGSIAGFVSGSVKFRAIVLS